MSTLNIPPELYLTSNNPSAAFDRLLAIMNQLREHCPWDKKQSLESLRYLTIEETYELSDAIISQNREEIKKELGDILLHIVFYAKIGSESNHFDMTSIINELCAKLIRRHPHIFADTHVNNEEDVKNNWEKIKLTEGAKKTVLQGVPKSLPAIIKAQRIQEKARGVGFDWEHTEQVWEKVKEELDELQHEIKTQEKSEEKDSNKEKIESEFGDVLFALINYARFLNINPEDALEKTNRKFISRFNYLESQTLGKGLTLHDMSLDEMNAYWEEAKTKDKDNKNHNF